MPATSLHAFIKTSKPFHIPLVYPPYREYYFFFFRNCGNRLQESGLWRTSTLCIPFLFQKSSYPDGSVRSLYQKNGCPINLFRHCFHPNPCPLGRSYTLWSVWINFTLYFCKAMLPNKPNTDNNTAHSWLHQAAHCQYTTVSDWIFLRI